MTTRDDTVGPSVIQAALDFTGAGDNTIISGTINQRIKVLQLFFVVNAAVNLKFKSGSAELTGVMNFQANGSMFMDYIQLPLTCNEGDSFIINSSSGVQVSGTIWYTQG